MIKRVLIIGGYGKFGKFISAGLVCDDNIQLIISGRNQDKAKTFAEELVTPAVEIEIAHE